MAKAQTTRQTEHHYIANVRDLEFNLFEVLRLGDVLDAGGYGDLDADTARTMLDEVRRLAEGPIAESFVDADRNPPVFDAATHSITVSDEIKRTVEAVREAGWWRVGIAEEIGAGADEAYAKRQEISAVFARTAPS